MLVNLHLPWLRSSVEEFKVHLDSSWGKWERLGGCVLGTRVQDLWAVQALQVRVQAQGIWRVGPAVALLRGGVVPLH